MLDLVSGAVLGLVQGITAWIPVSSKTQVILFAQLLFSIPFKEALAFALLLHVGDLIAAVYRYREEYFNTLLAARDPVALIDFTSRDYPDKEHSFLVISAICTVLVALPLYFVAKGFFADLKGEWLLAAVGLMLVSMATVSWASREYSPKEESPHGADITLPSAIITGFAQGLAVLPGVSRSGITQSALAMQGFQADKAVRLSFMMSAPMILAAIVAFYLLEGGFAGIPATAILAGLVLSTAASLASMEFFSEFASRIPAHYFQGLIGLLALVPLIVMLQFGISE